MTATPDMTRERARTERRDLDKERGEPVARRRGARRPARLAKAARPLGDWTTRPRILVTNDDGIESRGLLALKQALDPIGDVTVVAPDTNQSAVGHQKTLMRPLRVRERTLGDGSTGYSVDGSPTDAVSLAFLGYFGHGFDLVASGHQLRRQPRRRHHLLGDGQRGDGGGHQQLPGLRDLAGVLRAPRLRPGGDGRETVARNILEHGLSPRRAHQRQRAGRADRGVRRVRGDAPRQARLPGPARSSGSTRVGSPTSGSAVRRRPGWPIEGTDFHAVVNRRIAVTPDPPRPHRPTAAQAPPDVVLAAGGSRPGHGRGRRPGESAPDAATIAHPRRVPPSHREEPAVDDLSNLIGQLGGAHGDRRHRSDGGPGRPRPRAPERGRPRRTHGQAPRRRPGRPGRFVDLDRAEPGDRPGASSGRRSGRTRSSGSSNGSGIDIAALLPMLAAFLPQIVDMLTPDGQTPAGGLTGRACPTSRAARGSSARAEAPARVSPISSGGLGGCWAAPRAATAHGHRPRRPARHRQTSIAEATSVGGTARRLEPQPAAMEQDRSLAVARIERFLEQEPIVWLSTVRPDGAPHIVPIWFWWDGEALLVFSKPDAQKVRNLRARPAAMLALGDAEDGLRRRPDRGSGRAARPTDGRGAPAAHLAKYAEQMAALIGLTADEYAATYSLVIRIVPDRFIGWHGRTLPASARRAGARRADRRTPQPRPDPNGSRSRSSAVAGPSLRDRLGCRWPGSRLVPGLPSPSGAGAL